MVAKALANGGEAELVDLMARFRRAFVDALQPRHLSPAWQIGHRRVSLMSIAVACCFDIGTQRMCAHGCRASAQPVQGCMSVDVQLAEGL